MIHITSMYNDAFDRYHFLQPLCDRRGEGRPRPTSLYRFQLYSGGNVYLPRKKRELCHSLAIVKFIAMVIFIAMAISVLTMVITHCMLPSKSTELRS